MATKSTKRKPAPTPISVRAPKTRLTKYMRDTLHRFMVAELRTRLDRTEIDRTRADLVEKTNVTVISPDILSRIKSDFAQAEAA